MRARAAIAALFKHRQPAFIMILILKPNIDTEGETYRQLMARLSRLPNISVRVHREQGAQQCLTELYLIGDTAAVALSDVCDLPGVERAVRVSEEYCVIGRHRDDERTTHFEYQGVRFGQDTLQVFAGLCAVDTPGHVEPMMRALRDAGQVGARTSAPDRILDIMHVTAQGVIAGANMVLVDFYPAPEQALVDGPQALTLRELPHFLGDVALAREAYLKRVELAGRYRLAS